MPKKKQRNGFYYFMRELLSKYHREGKIEYTMQTIAPDAHPLWKNLPQDRKDHYNRMAKENKEYGKNTLEGKLNCLGENLKEVLNEEKEREEEEQAKLRVVKAWIKGLGTKQGVANETFHIISFNVFCITQEGEYVPAEVGLIEYCVSKGIIREYHEFIDPGTFPIGYQYTAVEHSEGTHKIPVKDFVLSNKNYMHIYRSIKSFITKKASSCRVFCFPDEMDAVKGVLDWLRIRAHVTLPHEIEVYDLATLLLELRQFASQSFVETHSFAKDILAKNAFDYVSNVSCAWHEEQDVANYCALGIVKRYCYLMSEYLCKAYGVDMIPYKHVPPRDEAENISIIDPLTVKRFTDKARPFRPPLRNHSKFDHQQSSTAVATRTIVTSLPSKYSTDNPKVIIPGSDPGVMTEIPILKTKNPEKPRVSVAQMIRKPDEFNLDNDDFPSLGTSSLGRGRGRGWFALSDPENFKSAGMGRGCGRGSGN